MKKHILNERIRGSKIRLVGHEKHQNDVVDTNYALNLAREEGLDLVLINPKDSPVICKIMDYNKFLYNQKKHEKKNNNNPKLKEIKFSPNITDHDLDIKIKQARGFIEKGSNIKIEVFFKGREITHKEIGKERLLKFLNGLVDIATFTLDIVFTGKKIIHEVRPKKT